MEYFSKFLQFRNVLYGSIIFFPLSLFSLHSFVRQFSQSYGTMEKIKVPTSVHIRSRYSRREYIAEKQRDEERRFAVELILSIRRPRGGKTIVKQQRDRPRRCEIFFFCSSVTNYLYSRPVFRSENRNNA